MIPPIRKLHSAGHRVARFTRQTAVRARMRVARPSRPALVVCGSPRGGTTWIGSRLAAATNSIMIFEPLHPKATAAGEHGFGWGEYLRDEDLTGPKAEWLDAVLAGRAVNQWMAEDQPLRVTISSRSILVKSVRANGLLNAIDASPRCLEPLVVVRHPVATVASQLAEGSWRHPESIDLSGFTSLWPEHADAVDSVRRPEEYLAAAWCAEQIAATDPEKRGGWMVVHYEDVVADAESALLPVISRWQLQARPGVDWETVSRTSKGGVVLGRHDLEPEVVDSILRTVARFGITAYGADPEPIERFPFRLEQ